MTSKLGYDGGRVGQGGIGLREDAGNRGTCLGKSTEFSVAQ